MEKQIAPTAPPAAVLSNKLYVDNNYMRDNLFDLEERIDGNLSGKGIIFIPDVRLVEKERERKQIQ